MKIKYLAQALRFACLPTLAVLILLFFGFFDITKTIDFISSDKTFAVILRVILVIAEIGLVYFMYKEYEKQDVINSINKEGRKGRSISGRSELYNLNVNWDYRDNYVLYPTENESIIILEREPRS